MTELAVNTVNPVEDGPAARRLTWSDRLSDRVNPILVREVLQAVAGRMFVIALAVAAFCIVLIALAVVAESSVHDSDTGLGSGSMVLSWALAALVPIVIFHVPLQAFMSMRHEVMGNTVEQVLLTGLTPRRIVLGKLAAALVMFGVFLGMFAPLLALTFLLRGIDVPTIAVMLLFTLCASVTTNAFAIAMGALCRVRGLAVLALVAAIAGLAIATLVCMVNAFILVREIQRQLSDPDFIAAAIATCLAFACATWLFSALAGAVLAHEYENRAGSFRAFALALPVVAFAWMAYALSPHELGEAGPACAGILAAILAPVLIATACERDGLSPRVAAHVPASNTLAWLALPFLPGAGRGLLTVVAAMALSMGLGVVVPLFVGAIPRDGETAVMIAAWSYLWMLCIVARTARRLLGPAPRWFWVALLITAATFALGMIATLVIWALGSRDNQWSVLHLFNAPWTLAEIAVHPQHRWAGTVLVVIAAFMTVLVLPSMTRGVTEVREASRARREREAADAA